MLVDDKELYKRFLSGDSKSLDELIERHRKDVIYFIQKYVGDYFLAEDISQEVFVYLLQHKHVYKLEYTFKTYLFTIAKSRAINYLKRNKKMDFIEDNMERILSDIRYVEDEVFKNEDTDMVRRAIRKLKKEHQVAIYLVDLRGLSYKELAIVLDKSMVQVKALIHNARKRLKEVLEEEKLREVEHNEVNRGVHK